MYRYNGKKLPQKKMKFSFLNRKTGRLNTVYKTPGPREEKGHMRDLQDQNSSCDNEDFDLGNCDDAFSFDNDMGDFTDASVSEGKKQSGRSWHEVRKKERLAWDSIMNDLLVGGSYLLSGALASRACVSCQSPFEEEEEAYRCRDCSLTAHFCLNCVRKEHMNFRIDHRLEQFKNGSYTPIKNHPWLSILEQIDHKEQFCVKKWKEVACIDKLGYQHQVMMETCSCFSDAFLMVCSGYWPGTATSPKIMFSFDFMENLYLMHYECQVALRKCCDSLLRRNLQFVDKKVGDLYKTLNRCFGEYCVWRHSCKYCKFVDVILDDGVTCPACPKEKGVVVACFDACFGLVRKHRGKAAEIDELLSDNVFFDDQKKVDSFVSDHNLKTNLDVNSSNKECSSFHAGELENSVRSKGQNSKLDEKAVLGSVCRHDYPQRFFSCNAGEKIGYAVYALKEFLASLHGPEIEPIFIYDIACLLKKHLKRNKLEGVLGNAKLALPAFHVYGHALSCQLEYSSRRQKDFCLTDGEGAERLWSFLSEFSRITKEMTPFNRVRTLDFALLHYCERKRSSIGQHLLEKTKKVEEMMSIAKDKLNASLALYSCYPEVKEASIKSWITAEQTAFSSKTVKPKQTTQWEVLYVQMLQKLEAKRDVVNVLTTNEENAVAVEKARDNVSKHLEKVIMYEKKHMVICRWNPADDKYKMYLELLIKTERKTFGDQCRATAYERMMLLDLKKKLCSGGQSINQKLSQQIKSVTSKLKKKVKQFNETFVTPGYHPPIALEDVLDLSNQLYSSSTLSASTVPASIQRELMDSYHFKERCEEELRMLSDEKKAVVSFFRSEICKISLLLTKHETSRFHALLQARLVDLKHSLATFYVSFKSLDEGDAVPRGIVMMQTLNVEEILDDNGDEPEPDNDETRYSDSESDGDQ